MRAKIASSKAKRSIASSTTASSLRPTAWNRRSKREFFHPENDPPTAEISFVAVDFGTAGFLDIGWITTLDAPHRIADAIFRDSFLCDQPFRKTPTGRAFH